jgi:RNA polymerase sigma factor (sigma-70 family)
VRPRSMKSSAAGRAAVWTAAVSAAAIVPHATPVALGIAMIKEIFDLLRARTDRVSVLSYMRAASASTYLNIDPSGEAPAIVLSTTSSPSGPPQDEEGLNSMSSNEKLRRVDCDLDPSVFCAKHRRDWLSYARSHTRNWYDADDAVSHVVEQIFRHHSEHGMLCPVGYDPVAWSKRVIANYIKDLWRRQKAQLKRSAAMLPPPGDFADDILDRMIVEDALDFISTLGPHAHQIAMMHWGEGLPPKEIAKQLGLNAISVRTSLYRTRKKMRIRLGIVDDPPRVFTKETT